MPNTSTPGIALRTVAVDDSSFLGVWFEGAVVAEDRRGWGCGGDRGGIGEDFCVGQWDDDAGDGDEGFGVGNRDLDVVLTGFGVIGAGEFEDVAAAQHGDDILQVALQVSAGSWEDGSSVALTYLPEELFRGEFLGAGDGEIAVGRRYRCVETVAELKGVLEGEGGDASAAECAHDVIPFDGAFRVSAVGDDEKDATAGTIGEIDRDADHCVP